MKFVLIYFIFYQSFTSPSIDSGVKEFTTMSECSSVGAAMAKTAPSGFVFKFSCAEIK